MIKFRAWDKTTQKNWNIDKWHFEDEYLDLIEPGVSICDPRIERIWRKQGDVEIMQYTGLKDKQGIEIYEGDILRFGSVWCVGDEYDPREEEHIGAVKYCQDYASYVVNCNGKIFPLEQVISFDGYSVQGNVHTNPELLEEEK